MIPASSLLLTNFIAFDFDLENQWNSTAKAIEKRLNNIEIQQSTEPKSLNRRLSYSEAKPENEQNVWNETANRAEGISSRLRPRKQHSNTVPGLCYSKQFLFDKEKIEKQTFKTKK